MSRLARFARKPEILEFEVEDEEGKPITEKIKVTPLKLKNQALIMELTGGAGPEAGKKAVRTVLEKVLKDNGIEGYTEEELQDMDWEFVDPILSAIIKINNISMDDAKQKFVESIKQKQAETAKKKAEAKPVKP